MFKKSVIVLFSLIIMVAFASVTLTQDQPGDTKKDEKKTEEKKTDEKKTDEKKTDEKKTDEKKTDEKKTDEKKSDDTKKDDSTTKKESNAKIAKSYVTKNITYINPKVSFELTSTDDTQADKIMFSIDGKAAQEYKSPITLKEEGKHVINYYGIDKMGNQEEMKSFSVMVDASSPIVTVTTDVPVIKVKEKLYASGITNYMINANDSLSGVDKVVYSTDGTKFNEYNNTFNIVKDGEITLTILAHDKVANYSEKFVFKAKEDSGKMVKMNESSVKINIDKKAPTIEIKADKDFIMVNGQKVASVNYKYKVEAKDEGAGVAQIMVRINGKGEFVPYTEEIKFTKSGKYLIEAIAKDKVGNVSKTATLSVYVDVNPPESKINMVGGKQ